MVEFELLFKNVNAGCRFEIQWDRIPTLCTIDFYIKCSNNGVASHNMYILIMPSEVVMFCINLFVPK